MTIEIRELIIEARVNDDSPATTASSAGLTPHAEAQLVERIKRQLLREVMAQLRDELWRFK